MGCGASTASEPPSQEGSAGKTRSENKGKHSKELEANGQISNGQLRNKHLNVNEENNNGSQDSLNKKNKKSKAFSNQVNPFEPQKPGQLSLVISSFPSSDDFLYETCTGGCRFIRTRINHG